MSAIHGKVVVDVGPRYVSLHLCDGNGFVQEYEVFKMERTLNRREAITETREVFHYLYDYLNDLANGWDGETASDLLALAQCMDRRPAMPSYEATPEELQKYGASLSVWDQLRLLSAWSPLIAYGQRFVQEVDPYKKGLIIGEAAEWLASKTDTTTDDQLVRLLADVAKTQQGEALIRFCLLTAEGKK